MIMIIHRYKQKYLWSLDIANGFLILWYGSDCQHLVLRNEGLLRSSVMMALERLWLTSASSGWGGNETRRGQLGLVLLTHLLLLTSLSGQSEQRGSEMTVCYLLWNIWRSWSLKASALSLAYCSVKNTQLFFNMLLHFSWKFTAMSQRS